MKEASVIMGIDPSVSNTGLFIYNNSIGRVELIKTISFTEKQKKLFCKQAHEEGRTEIADISKTGLDKDLRKHFNQLWFNERVNQIVGGIEKEIVDKKVDTIAIETQVQNESLIAVVGAINVLAGKYKCQFQGYKPKQWKKRLTGNGNIPQAVLDHSTEEFCGIYFKAMDEHSIDAYCILATYLKDINVRMREISLDKAER